LWFLGTFCLIFLLVITSFGPLFPPPFSPLASLVVRKKPHIEEIPPYGCFVSFRPFFFIGSSLFSFFSFAFSRSCGAVRRLKGRRPHMRFPACLCPPIFFFWWVCCSLFARVWTCSPGTPSMLLFFSVAQIYLEETFFRFVCLPFFFLCSLFPPSRVSAQRRRA